ncbi:hypothetical protein HDU79_004633 [Rhizoclosmatium sp. JEL0117]|nr:hypothetical protein HDU79_004633 [Rhizoclosmatium sp. JEL0117]
MDSYTATNIAVGICCAVILIVYHLWLASVVRTNPQKTVFGVTSHGRKAWVAVMMRDKKDICAVQSLRNLIMVSSILASTAVVLMFGFINFLSTISTNASEKNASNAFGFVVDEVFGAKVMILLFVYCISFFCFAQAMRFYNHTTMVININLPSQELERLQNNLPDELLRMGQGTPAARDQENERDILIKTSNIEFVGGMLNRGHLYHTAGLRGYYISFPIMGFLWGPWTLLACTIILIVLLRIVDFNLDNLSPTHVRPPAVASPKRAQANTESGHQVLIEDEDNIPMSELK